MVVLERSTGCAGIFATRESRRVGSWLPGNEEVTMTAQKHLKQRIRARMAKTGERYAAARRYILRTAVPTPHDSSARWHMPGNVAATTALRVLLAHAGVRAPHTGEPFSEAMLFGIAGGIGIGVFSFYYQREDIATFYVAGRHQWHDDLAYLRDALAGFAIEPVVMETGGASTAARQLTELLDQHGPCIAWVDMAKLHHRALPSDWSGSAYHIITVYSINPAAGTALIGDLADQPIVITLDDLARARARIVKQRHRLLTLAPADPQIDLAELVRRGLQRCYQGLIEPSLTQAPNNARLAVLRTWAERMYGSQEKDRWERIFQPGANLWRGLNAIHGYIEHYGTGGGLCRPLFADFLTEAAAVLQAPALAALGQQYAALGRSWSELADAALPDHVAAMRATKQLHVRRTELLHSGDATAELQAIEHEITSLAQAAGEHFPLPEAGCTALRAQLAQRIHALHDAEVAAHAALGQAIA
jgi:hypothetical protein